MQASNTMLNSLRISQENALSENNDVQNYLNLSNIHAILDERSASLKYYSQAVDLGLTFNMVDFLEIHPFYKNFHEDPEFKAIIKRLKDKRAAQRAIVQEMIESGEIDL